MPIRRAQFYLAPLMAVKLNVTFSCTSLQRENRRKVLAYRRGARDIDDQIHSDTERQKQHQHLDSLV